MMMTSQKLPLAVTAVAVTLGAAHCGLTAAEPVVVDAGSDARRAVGRDGGRDGSRARADANHDARAEVEHVRADTGVDAGVDPGETRDGTVTRDAGTTDDAGTAPDVGTCSPPVDATVATQDGSLCVNGNCERGGIPCCFGAVCVPCALVTSDGSFVLNVEAGPFYCNVPMR